MNKIKIFLVGEHFDSMFKFANANIEFLNPVLQNKVLNNFPMNPFSILDELIKDGTITHFSSIFDIIEHNKNRCL